MLPPRTCAALLLLLSACATTQPSRKVVARDRGISNLRRAATLPWVDDGRCAVREASGEWAVLVERCFHALDVGRVRFRDITGKCRVAQAGEATMMLEMGLCILAGPEIAGAVIVIGSAVVVAYAIHEALEAYERSAAPGRRRPEVQAPSGGDQPSANRRLGSEPEPEGGGDVLPPKPPDVSDPLDRDECIPMPVIPPLGSDKLHDLCAKNVPGNAFRGADVLVNGKAFDALQPATRTLWEVKTNDIKRYNQFVRDTELEKQVKELLRERALARACGYDFKIGVLTATHKEALERADKALEGLIVLMDWC